MNEIEEIKKRLSNKMWRLTSGKLYKIKDKDWRIVPFIPNANQLDFYSKRHNLNIIPKARQLWFSTAIDIDAFDDFLFRRNINVGIIADTLDIANEIFRDKILVARDNLPDWLKSYYKLQTDRHNELSIENTWSRISVGTSYRWWVLQVLHISEFGKICNKYPDKAEEIVRGALQTVWLWNKIDIESTAMGAEGRFYEYAKKAKDNKDSGKDLGPMEYKLHFYAWWQEKWYSYDGNVIIPWELVEYFQELSLKWIDLTEWQKKWYALKYQDLQEWIYQEYPSTFDEAFRIAIKGAYYEQQLWLARLQRRICKVRYEPLLQVHTSRDIWGAWGWDDTAIRFFQIYWHEIRVIDYREGNNRSLLEIIETVIKPRNYKYWTFFGPHDLWVVEYSYGESRFEVAKKHWVTFTVLPMISVAEWIDMAKRIFGRCWFDETLCADWITKLWLYRRAWDERNWVFLDRPMKNGADHCADSFRYLAMWLAIENKKSDAVITSLQT